MLQPGSKVNIKNWSYPSDAWDYYQARVISVARPHPRGYINVAWKYSGKPYTARQEGFLFTHEELEEVVSCRDCHEDDPSVLVACRDGIARCAHHANRAGWCWWCGAGDPIFDRDDSEDGMCHDCRSASLRRT